MSQTRNALTPELCLTFVTMVRLGGSVSATARELKQSDANVSKRIRPLVRGNPPGLPQAWIVKQGRRFVLTDEGRRMLPLAEEQAQRWSEFIESAATDRAAGVTVACGNEAAGGVVLAAATQFRRQHPNAGLRVAVVRGKQRIEGVVNKRYDLALVTDNPVGVRETARRPVIVESLAEDELVLACAVRSPWANTFTASERAVAVDEVTAWPLVLPESDSAIRKCWDELLRRRSPSALPTVAIEVGGWRVLLGYVLAGFGVGLLPSSVVAAVGTKVRTRPLVPSLRPMNRLSVVRLADSTDTKLLNDFRTALTAATAGAG